MKIYVDASVGLGTGFGILEVREDGASPMQYCIEEVLDTDRPEMLALWLALDRSRNENCDVTDRLPS